MQQLTGLDAAFLALETPSVYGHVGSVSILDISTVSKPFDLARLTSLIESRLPLLPPFRRRLVTVPFGLDQPYWIEDPCFDIEYHVREIALPAPGTRAQLTEQAARLHARPLDRARPLWEAYLITGLEDGRAAVYTKVHHAAIDGISGNDLLAAVLDVSPEGRPTEAAAPPAPEQPPSNVALLARSARSLATQPLRGLRLAAEVARSVPALVGNDVRPRLPIIDSLLRPDSRSVLTHAGLRAPHTPFNAPVSPHRRWAMQEVSLEDIKRVKNAYGVTVNDVVMALSTGALRRWLTDHNALPADPLVAAVPVSVRTKEQEGTLGNQVSMMLAPIPTNIDDPRERLVDVHESMAVAKHQHGALPASLLADVTQVAMPAVAGQAMRLSARLRLVERANPFNLIISNVPGGSGPYYYAGAKLESLFPLSAIADGQGLNITVLGYGGKLHFGLIACRKLVPDLDRLAGYLADELKLLVDLLPEQAGTQASEGRAAEPTSTGTGTGTGTAMGTGTEIGTDTDTGHPTVVLPDSEMAPQAG